MKKIIIFDFNRTIYNPDTDKLAKDVYLVLDSLLNFDFELYLISRGGETRKSLIDKLQINKYFMRVIISKEKNMKDFQTIITEEVDCKNSFIVGDRIKQEITFGNILGLQTIWLRSGKFSNELPTNKKEKPRYVIRELKEVLQIIC